MVVAIQYGDPFEGVVVAKSSIYGGLKKEFFE